MRAAIGRRQGTHIDRQTDRQTDIHTYIYIQPSPALWPWRRLFSRLSPKARAVGSPLLPGQKCKCKSTHTPKKRAQLCATHTYIDTIVAITAIYLSIYVYVLRQARAFKLSDHGCLHIAMTASGQQPPLGCQIPPPQRIPYSSLSLFCSFVLLCF